MDLGSRIAMTEREILRSVRVFIADKCNKYFYAYLMLGAQDVIKGICTSAFKMYIRDMTSRLQDKVAFAAMNLVFALQVAADNGLVGEEAVQKFAAGFIKNQMADFYEWSADLA